MGGLEIDGDGLVGDKEGGDEGADVEGVLG